MKKGTVELSNKYLIGFVFLVILIVVGFVAIERVDFLERLSSYLPSFIVGNKTSNLNPNICLIKSAEFREPNSQEEDTLYLQVIGNDKCFGNELSLSLTALKNRAFFEFYSFKFDSSNKIQVPLKNQDKLLSEGEYRGDIKIEGKIPLDTNGKEIKQVPQFNFVKTKFCYLESFMLRNPIESQGMFNTLYIYLRGNVYCAKKRVDIVVFNKQTSTFGFVSYPKVGEYSFTFLESLNKDKKLNAIEEPLRKEEDGSFYTQAGEYYAELYIDGVKAKNIEGAEIISTPHLNFKQY